MTLGGQSLSMACTLPMLDPTERQKIPISLTFKVTEGTDETELKIWFRVFHPRKLKQWYAKHSFLMVCYGSPVNGLLAVNTKTQERVENLSRSAPWLGQGSPHSSVSVCKGFYAPPQSLQKANLARADSLKQDIWVQLLALPQISCAIAEFVCVSASICTIGVFASSVYLRVVGGCMVRP